MGCDSKEFQPHFAQDRKCCPAGNLSRRSLPAHLGHVDCGMMGHVPLNFKAVSRVCTVPHFWHLYFSFVITCNLQKPFPQIGHVKSFLDKDVEQVEQMGATMSRASTLMYGNNENLAY